MRSLKSLFFIAGGILAVLSAAFSYQQTAPNQPGASDQRAMLDKYCVTCHNSRLKTGGLALDAMDFANVPAGGEVWEKVIRKVRGNQMPPAGMPRPDPAAASQFVASLETALDRDAAAAG